MIIDYLVEKCIAWGIADSDNKDIYIYGINNLFIILINLVSVVMLGVIFNSVLQVIWFMLNFVFLRSYLGGFHLNSHVHCYLISNVIIITSIKIASIIPIGILIAFSIISSIFIWRFAPINCPKRCYDHDEARYFGKKCKTVLLCEVGMCLTLYATNQVNFLSVGLTSIIVAGVLGMTGTFYNKYS